MATASSWHSDHGHKMKSGGGSGPCSGDTGQHLSASFPRFIVSGHANKHRWNCGMAGTWLALTLQGALDAVASTAHGISDLDKERFRFTVRKSCHLKSNRSTGGPGVCFKHF